MLFAGRLFAAVAGVDSHQNDAVRRNGGFELVGALREVLLPPQVAHGLPAAQTQHAEREVHLHGLPAPVEKPDGHRAVFEVLGVDHLVALLPDGNGLQAQRVLVDVDHFVVGQQAPCEVICAMSQPISSGAASSDQRLMCVYCSSAVSCV